MAYSVAMQACNDGERETVVVKTNLRTNQKEKFGRGSARAYESAKRSRPGRLAASLRSSCKERHERRLQS